MFSFLMITISITLICIFVKLWGKEKFADTVSKWLDKGSGRNLADYNFGLLQVEAVDFSEKLTDFFETVTVADYSVDSSGWIIITYAVSGIKGDDIGVIKRAICLELHNYILVNHGLNLWNCYIPTLTKQIMILKIAASPMAQEELAGLSFEPEKDKTDTPMVDD